MNDNSSFTRKRLEEARIELLTIWRPYFAPTKDPNIFYLYKYGTDCELLLINEKIHLKIDTFNIKLDFFPDLNNYDFLIHRIDNEINKKF